MRTGKRMANKYSGIVINFKKLPGVLYFEDKELGPNLLVIRVQPMPVFFLSLIVKNRELRKLLFPYLMDFVMIP